MQVFAYPAVFGDSLLVYRDEGHYPPTTTTKADPFNRGPRRNHSLRLTPVTLRGVGFVVSWCEVHAMSVLYSVPLDVVECPGRMLSVDKVKSCRLIPMRLEPINLDQEEVFSDD